MPLFLVQDDDRPMYVLAEDWTAALTEWRDKIADENGIDGDKENPLGVQLICEDDDVLIQRKVQAEIRNPSCKDPWHTAVRRETEQCPSCGFEPEVYKRLRESGAWQKSGIGINDPPINSPIKCPNCESMSYYTDGNHKLICSVCQYIAPSPK